VLFGGRSGEHEVSLISAQSVVNAIDKEKYEVVPIGITRDGKWLTAGDPMKQLQAATRQRLALPTNHQTNQQTNKQTNQHTTPTRDLAPVDATELTTEHSPLGTLDVVFPVLHGPYGEDGTVQGLLQLANIPYVGAGVAASAVGMDKVLMKAIFRAHGLPVAEYWVVKRKDWQADREHVIRQIEKRFTYPCFVKPANLGSSVGVSKAHHREELIQGLETAAQYDRKLIVEQAVDARELECSVLGNDAPLASLVGEVIPAREFYDYEAKYSDPDTRLVVPADIPVETAQGVRELAVKAFLAIDCAGMARVDLFLERESGTLYLNEINTIPGFTAVSMYPKMWEASGLTYPQLIDRLIELALERHADRQRDRVER